MYSKWEYKREITNGGVISEEKLNKLGAEGWEGYDHEGNVYFFKRQEATVLTPLVVEKTDNKITGNDKKSKGK